MKNDKFICPICGSTHFEHIISKTHPNIFGIRCNKCGIYVGWLPKSMYNDWRNGNIEMNKIKPSTETEKYMKMMEFFRERGFKQLNSHTFTDDSFVIRLDKQIVTYKETGEKISLEDFVREMKQ